ncbi:MAG TPA: MFS transporter, partial [Streptosporangiaceae bacterium]
AESVGLIVGGFVSLKFTPRRPMLFVVLIGGAIAISPASLASPWPLPVVCLASLCLGVTMEIMMVQWTVALARNIPARIQARVSSYDALGSVMAMPLGAVVVGPIAAAVGVPATDYGAGALIIIVALLALIPREIRQLRTVPAVPAADLTGPPGEAPAADAAVLTGGDAVPAAVGAGG